MTPTRSKTTLFIILIFSYAILSTGFKQIPSFRANSLSKQRIGIFDFDSRGLRLSKGNDNNDNIGQSIVSEGGNVIEENEFISDSSVSSAQSQPYISATVKIKEEIASPFRRFRQFIYIACFMGGGLGFVTALPALILAIQKGGTDSTATTTALTNVAVDLGGVLGGIFFWIREYNDEQEKLKRFAQKEQLQSSRLSENDIADRSKEISRLPVEIIFSESDKNATRVVSIGDLQEKGQQNVVIVTGKKSFVKDAILSARIEGNELFNSKNTMIVPVILDDKQKSPTNIEEKGKNNKGGFGTGGNSNASLMEAPYIANAVQVSVWERYLRKEIELAQSQGTKNVLAQGLVIVVKQNGQVTRRGLGLPPWKKLVEDF